MSSARIVTLVAIFGALSACAKKPPSDPYASPTAGGETAGQDTAAGSGPEPELGRSDPSTISESDIEPAPVAPGNEAPAR